VKKGPVYAIIGSVLLLLCLLLVNTKPPKVNDSEISGEGDHMASATKSVDFDSIVIASKKNLGQHGLSELQKVELQLKSCKDSSEMIPYLDAYADVWKEHKAWIPAAYYYSLAAKLEKSEKKLNFAAQLFLDLARNEHSEGLMSWEVAQAVSNYELVNEMNPENDSAKIGLAECYFGIGEAMKGVVLLKEVTSKTPEHKEANLLLGQQGLVSGQFDKSKERFETVLKNHSDNLEAMLGLAESLKGLGNTQEAKQVLEQCKKYIKNPAFAKDIDDYIKTF
jgi:lipopolysaccharide biosynthesis regulator YciM